MAQLLDPCLAYLKEAENIASNYVELSTYQILFEADESGKTDEIVKNNQKVEAQSTSMLKKACSAIKELINKIIDSIKNFVAKITMSKEEKAKYEEFLAKAANDPELRGKKIKVMDWKKINAAYDQALKEIEETIKNTKNMNDAEAEARANKIISDIKKKIGDVAGATATVIGIDTARKIADSSKETAKYMSKLLNDESIVMTHLENTLGEKGAQKFKKDIKSSGRLISLHRFKVWLLNKKYNSAKDCFYGTIKEIKDISSGNLGKVMTSNMAKDAARVVNPDQDPNVTMAKAGAKAAIGTVKAKNAKKRLDKEKENVKKMKNFWS